MVSACQGVGGENPILVRCGRQEGAAPYASGTSLAPIREEFFDIAEAQGEPMVQPDAVADDLTRNR